jgi:Zn-dependent peptidase ImmA (M78 family)/DNA-binding XRE family transcriptional regulator
MNGDRLKRAREIKGWTQQELADEVGVTQAAIARIEQNLLPPSDQLQQQLALKLGFPVAFFHQENTIDFPLGSLLFRQHMTLKRRERDQILQTAWATYVLYHHMAQKLRLMPLRLPRVQDEDIKTTASLVRNALGIAPDGPVRNLVNRLEKAGVVVLSIPLDIHGHDAFSLWSERRAVIVLSHGKPGDRQRFTAAHEVGHLVQHYILWGSHAEVEKEANDFAYELLLPEEVMREVLVKPITLSSLAELKPRWGVPVKALIERAYQLQVISVDQRKYLHKQIQLQWKGREPSNLSIEPEKPRALRKMAEMLYGTKTGAVSYARLARDTAMPVSLVAEILDAHAAPHVGPKPVAQVRHFPGKDASKQENDDELEYAT